MRSLFGGSSFLNGLLEVFLGVFSSTMAPRGLPRSPRPSRPRPPERSPSAFEETSAAASAPCFRVSEDAASALSAASSAASGLASRLTGIARGCCLEREAIHAIAIWAVREGARSRGYRKTLACERLARVPRGNGRARGYGGGDVCRGSESGGHPIPVECSRSWALVSLSFAVTAMSPGVRHQLATRRIIVVDVEKKQPEQLSDLNSTRGAPDNLGAGSRGSLGRAVRRVGRRRRRRERRWGQRRAPPPHASFVHLPPDVRHLRVARGAVGRGRGPRDAREARAPARGRRERDHGS